MELPLNTPLDFFQLYFDHDLFELLARESTEYMHEIIKNQENKKTYNTKHYFEGKMNSQITINDIRAYLSIIMMMGIKAYPTIASHWSISAEFKDDLISKIMTQRRYTTINRAFHLTPNSTLDKDDPFAKITSFVNYLNDRFGKLYCPEQELTIDESLISFRGRVKFLFYIPSKPTRYGIKIHSLAESKSGYCLKILFDPGKAGKIQNENEKLIKPENVINCLIQDYLGKYYKLYTDSWYSSLAIFRNLVKNKTFSTGMINANRKYLNKNVVKMDREILKVASCNDILHFNFYDKRTKKHLNMVTTCHSTKMIIVQKNNKFIDIPECLDSYTKFMKGVDKMNQHIETYQYKHSSMKWWKRVFMALLEIALYNSYIVFIKIKKTEMHYLQYKLNVAKGLLDCYIKPDTFTLENNKYRTRIDLNAPIINVSNIHSIGKYDSKIKSLCKFCRKDNKKRIKTNFFCQQCEIPLCPVCHFKYHKKYVYGQQNKGD